MTGTFLALGYNSKQNVCCPGVYILVGEIKKKVFVALGKD